MRNFHRDFESLNEAYTNQIQTKCECTINESVTDDIATKHREGSLKSLREALRALAKAHHEDYSSVTMEDVYSEMKMYAEENLPTHTEYASVPTGPHSPIHNPSPMGIATEDTVDEELTKAQEKLPDALKKKIDPDHKETKEEGTDGSTHDLTDSEKERLKKYAGKEKVEEMSTHSPENSCKDDEYYCYDAKKCLPKRKVGENFEHMLEIMRLSDQAHPTSNDVVEEEMYDCIRDYMGEGMSYAEAMRECSGRGHEEAVQSESGCGTHKETDEDPDDDAEEKDVEEEAAETLGGVAGKKDAAFQKGLDAAFDIQAKVSAERNPMKRAMMGKSAKTISKGVDDYMGALTGKLKTMTNQLKSS